MSHDSFVASVKNTSIPKGEYTWEAPSNIALVKYWGKLANQIPANPSVSFTLSNCKTTTTLKFAKASEYSLFNQIKFDVFFEGQQKDSFKPKIANFFERIYPYCPYLDSFEFEIHSENSFPHSSGIASSASGMSALALCIMSLEKELDPVITEEYFYKKASFLARLGSGSACRSVQGNLVVWGEHAAIVGSSNEFGEQYPYKIHPIFTDFQDTILLVDKGKKQVSSTVGHSLMNGHPFAEARFKQAQKNLKNLIPVFESGDLEKFIEIVEQEALTLHAMMMSSNPYFILMKPNTLAIINKIWEKRASSGIPVCFTLDAGANVHLLYPSQNKEEILEFIKNELIGYCEKAHYICDEVGEGAKLL